MRLLPSGAKTDRVYGAVIKLTPRDRTALQTGLVSRGQALGALWAQDATW